LNSLLDRLRKAATHGSRRALLVFVGEAGSATTADAFALSAKVQPKSVMQERPRQCARRGLHFFSDFTKFALQDEMMRTLETERRTPKHFEIMNVYQGVSRDDDVRSLS
jgi:hypothetical protein